MDLTINFGTVALRSCPVFGALVFVDPGEWIPFSSIDDDGQRCVRGQVRNSPLQSLLTDRMRETLFGNL